MKDRRGDFVSTLLPKQGRDNLEGEVKGVGCRLSRDEEATLDHRCCGDSSPLQLAFKAGISNSFVSLQQVGTTEDRGSSTDSTKELASLVGFADELVQTLRGIQVSNSRQSARQDKC